VIPFNSEQAKYLWLNKNTDYGCSFHARGILDYLRLLKINSVCDVGTGKGEFCRWAVNNGCKDVYGIDFAIDPEPPSKSIKYIKAFAHDIPLSDNVVEYVTAFDVLEHIPEEDINITLKEFRRLASKGWIFSIAYSDSIYMREIVGTLHPTVKPAQWWYNKISTFGQVDFFRNYWLVTLKDNATRTATS